MNTSRIDALRNMISEQPNDPFLHYALASEYRLCARPVDSLVHYLKVIESDPGYSGAYLHLASLYTELDERENARKTYLQGLMVTLQKGDDHAYRELQGAYALFEDWAEDE